MNKLIIAVLIALCSLNGYAQIQAEVTPKEISAGEAFSLVIVKLGAINKDDVPDLSVLNQDFNVVGTMRSIEYFMVNGKSKVSTRWMVTLQPRKAGTLTIPPIKFKDEETPPLTVTVTGAGKTTTNNNTDSNDAVDTSKNTLLLTTVDEKKPYVNQQIQYTVKILHSDELINADYQPPKVENALLLPLGDVRRYETIKDGQAYVVEEQKYAIYPQKSGRLTIKSPSFKALVYDGFQNGVFLENQPTTVEIQPVPPTFQGKLWLPAKEVTLHEDYEKFPANIGTRRYLSSYCDFRSNQCPRRIITLFRFCRRRWL